MQASGINPKRIFQIKEGKSFKGPVVYWMQRDQRVNDNWALLYAQETALKNDVPLYVIFNLVNDFNNAGERHYSFMLKGLEKVDEELAEFNIPLFVLNGNPVKTIPEFIRESSASVLITDFNPVKNVLEWKEKVKEKIEIPFLEVDAHNIVPCRIVSGKQEFGAYTIRPKINRMLEEFLVEFPSLKKMKNPSIKTTNNWKERLTSIPGNAKVKEVNWIKPGEDEALFMQQRFIDERIVRYELKRNDPTSDVSSNLSPYFHFGQLAPQRAALVMQGLSDYTAARDSFLEELIVRRELSDNFCLYNHMYDSFEGFPNWAKETLNAHRKDKREFLYTIKEFEKAQTHDSLWNAAQAEMVIKGKMHGYLRMYWGKKILEWSRSPEEALETAIFLNDKYELDGRDPNGYAGIAWSIGGVHDRAWGERNVFGKIRYMNYNGCRRKFDVDLYIERINSLCDDI